MPSHGGVRKGSGRPPKYMRWQPFEEKGVKSDTVSKGTATIYRCNYCGAFWADDFEEYVYGWTGGQPTLVVERPEIEEHHKKMCLRHRE